MSDLLAQRKDFQRKIAQQPVIPQRRVNHSNFQSMGQTTSRSTHSQQHDSSSGRSAHEEAVIMSKIHQVIDFLKKSQRPCTVKELQLHVPRLAEDGPEFQHLSDNAKIDYDADNSTYAYKPDYDIRNADELVEYLRQIPDRGGLEVKKLSDSYLAELPKVIEDLRKKQLILAVTERENKPKYIYYNHLPMEQSIDEELKTSWWKMRVPDEPELSREMERASLKRMRVEKREEKEIQEVKKPKRAQRKTKITNTHLKDIDLTQDYVPESK